MEGETAWLIASTSGVPKGRRPRGGQSSPATARSPWSSRRPFPSAARSRRHGRRARAPSAPPRQPAHRPQLPLRRGASRRWPADGLVSASFLGALRQARRLRPLLQYSVHSALLRLRSVYRSRMSQQTLMHPNGFHGLSYEFIARTLPEYAPEATRVIVAHLGSGASLCALRDGKSVESTLGFSGLDGLPMGTRPGALDPGVILYLLQALGMDAKAI